jgi:signal-transduction protein with cAMP-binding, CBS, and nucleotidyltransferase domain
MIQCLREKLESIIPITDEMWYQIQSEWEEVRVKKGEKLVRYRELNKKIYFVLSGSLEISMILNDGSAKSVWFFLDEIFNVATTQDSAFMDEPTKYEITALEDSVLLRSDCNVLEETANLYPILHKFKAEDILYNFITMNEIRNHIIAQKPLDFLKYLQANYPSILRRIPNKNLANVMGITPEWYSKLKKKALT